MRLRPGIILDMKTPSQDFVDESWDDVQEWLPSDLDRLALETGALVRRRTVRTGAQLLRLAFAYSVLDLSLRSVTAWAVERDVGRMSDVALLKRLKGSVDMLQVVLAWLLSRRLQEAPVSAVPLRVRLVDATTVSAPGSKGTDWRIHASYDVARGEFDSLEVTDGRGGEHFGRVQAGPGELLVGDRGYAHGDRIAQVRAGGGHVLVRIGHSAVRLRCVSGDVLDPVAFATRRRPGPGRPPRVEGCDAVVSIADGDDVPVRLVVVRKSAQATDKERRRLRREASRKGKTPTDRTLQAAAYVFLLTTVPADMVEDATIAELYRVRWQVELAFKRLKSLGHLANLRAKDPELARTYVLSKLVAGMLADQISRHARAFSPWGLPIPRAGEPVALVSPRS